jgi:hypothetical protein
LAIFGNSIDFWRFLAILSISGDFWRDFWRFLARFLAILWRWIKSEELRKEKNCDEMMRRGTRVHNKDEGSGAVAMTTNLSAPTARGGAAMEASMQSVISAIHASPTRAVVYLAGGASQVGL